MDRRGKGQWIGEESDKKMLPIFTRFTSNIGSIFIFIVEIIIEKQTLFAVPVLVEESLQGRFRLT